MAEPYKADYQANSIVIPRLYFRTILKRVARHRLYLLTGEVSASLPKFYPLPPASLSGTFHASPITNLLEVRPMIKQYLLALYGPEEPIVFPRKSDHNSFLIRHLGRPPANARPDKGSGSTIEIALPFTQLKNLASHNYLGYHDRIAFRQELEREFVYNYHLFVREKMREGMERKTATLQFMEMHNITEDELTYSAFYRDFNRMLKKRRLTAVKRDIKIRST